MKLMKCLTAATLLACSFTVLADENLNETFKGSRYYDQNLFDWHVQFSPLYDTPINIKNQDLPKSVHEHYVGTQSVWFQSEAYTQSEITRAMGLLKKSIATKTAIPGKAYCDADSYYDAGFIAGLNTLADWDNLAKFTYNPANRAIMIDNAKVRLLPTNKAYIYDCAKAGEGNDMDYLENSHFWLGTPVYVVGLSQDQKWALLYTPDASGWVEVSKFAYVADTFIANWKAQADQVKGLVSVINPASLITETDNGTKYIGFLGCVLPYQSETKSLYTISVPVQGANGLAEIHTATVSTHDAVRVPYTPTPRHFIRVINSQLGRPYAWGGGTPYGWNEPDLYNDTSSQLKDLFAPFGIWLPKYSKDQIDLISARKELSGLPTETKERIQYLKDKGHPFMTIVDLDGGDFLYIGNYTDPAHPELGEIPLTFQTIWSLRTADGSGRRGVLAKANILPLLDSYPEDSALLSWFDKTRANIRMIYLDDAPST